MKKYEVLAPYVVFSIKDGKKAEDYSLRKGQTLEAPESNITVRALLARKQIREIEVIKEPTKN